MCPVEGIFGRQGKEEFLAEGKVSGERQVPGDSQGVHPMERRCSLILLQLLSPYSSTGWILASGVSPPGRPIPICNASPQVLADSLFSF